MGRSGHASRRSDQGLARLPLFFAHHGSCGCARDAVALLAGGPAAGARSRSRRDTDAAPGRRWATPSRLHYSSSEASGEWGLGSQGGVCGIKDGAAARCDTWSTPAVVVSTIDCRVPRGGFCRATRSWPLPRVPERPWSAFSCPCAPPLSEPCRPLGPPPPAVRRTLLCLWGTLYQHTQSEVPAGPRTLAVPAGKYSPALPPDCAPGRPPGQSATFRGRGPVFCPVRGYDEERREREHR